jgi:hypothetical protein
MGDLQKEVRCDCLQANILTGAVNVSVNTLEIAETYAWIIMLVYMLLICTAAMLWKVHGIAMKV